MSDDAHLYRAFCCPHEPMDTAFMERIATTHFRRALRTFVSRSGGLLEERGTGLVGVFEPWLDAPTDFETVWHLSFGKMRECLAQQHGPATTADIVLCAARLGLRLCEMGKSGSFSLALEAPHRFRFGRSILPMCDRLDVVAEKGEGILGLSLGTDRRVVRIREGSADAAELIPTFDTGMRTIGLLMPDTPEGEEYKEDPLVVDDTVRSEIASGYKAAFATLKEYAPIYVPFVDRLLRHLVPVASPSAYLGGGSFRDNAGTVKLPFGPDPAGLAANLGHECAHQHYFLLRGAGAVDNGSDVSGYRSGFIDGERDLPSMVLTYHAFANEALVLRMCERGGIPDPRAGQRAELLRQTLAPIEEILAKSKALTPLGQALWKPAAEQLHRAFG